MTAFINSSLNHVGTNDKNGERMANYIFTRAHDTEAQTIIQRIIVIVLTKICLVIISHDE
ncbi:MAG: glycoside hydrolase family 70 protein [Streptococcus sp.]